MRKYLYVSALLSERQLIDIFNKTKINPGFAIQKFSRLLATGLKENGVDVTAFSSPPITRDYTTSLFSSLSEENEQGVLYHYIPFINLPILKHLSIFFYSFFYVLSWSLNNKKEGVIICDVLCISPSLGSLLAAKLCGLKTVAIVTDIYEQMVGAGERGLEGFLSRLAGYINNLYVRSFSAYVLLTEAMNALVNPHSRPYIVMEALCNDKIRNNDIPQNGNACPKVLLYAGGLEEKYGIKMLVRAVQLLPDQNIQLHLYGAGSYLDELLYEIKTDNRIKYLGVVSNEEIIEAEYNATLLINPRFSTEEFTKYSFPSKNMEYMASGTPLLTTKLPGMPKDYYPFVFLIEDETVEGYAHAISKVLSKTDEELMNMGIRARDYVLRNKNYVLQASRIIELINGDV